VPQAAAAAPVEARAFEIGNIRFAYVFYESGLSINVLYTIDDPEERAVGFKLSEGMNIPPELGSKLKFASGRSKLGGTIRGFLLRLQERLLIRTCPALLPPHDSAIAGCEARLARTRGP
jgi:hypothetical protein